MSNTLSRKQIQKMRRLTNAKFPMLGVVAVAALFVVRVPIIQSWELRADARKAQQQKVAKTDSVETDSPKGDQVATNANSQADSESDAKATDTEGTDQENIISNQNWFDLLTQFQPRERNDDFPQNDSSQDTSLDDDAQTDGQDDLQLRHVSQLLGPEPDDSQLDDQALKLHNPASNRGVVYFVVDEDTYSIDVGQTLELTGKDQWLVMFHRGGDFGNARRILKPGSYSFSVSKLGWKLE